MKAIHNTPVCPRVARVVVINHKTTKFESNSQQISELILKVISCYQSQNYKIWKQFTTYLCRKISDYVVLSITKLQNLKAIHNEESNSIRAYLVVINHKTTKFESNSQPDLYNTTLEECCYQSQNYKIWKQFTTIFQGLIPLLLLLSITKLQNLKAIHNSMRTWATVCLVVINHKTTKFESNSQQGFTHIAFGFGCYQSQNYKIWKQFTKCISK